MQAVITHDAIDVRPVARRDSIVVDTNIATSPTDLSSVSTQVVWVPVAPPSSTQRISKGVMFAIVVLIHALVLYGLSRIPNKQSHQVATSMQVVSIQLSQTARTNFSAPVPMPMTMNLPQPIEPVVEIEPIESTSSVSVAPLVSDSSNGSITLNGAPKTVSSVEYVREPVAKYPSAARALKQRGTVTLRALIDINGRAREVNVQTSSGFRLLDDTAREAVANALFKPYTENGRSIPVYVLIPIEFGARG